ncbi:flagellar biosynthesis anti-sigma factor FlgM [Vibrio harveyi]|nr:flagellar biosynthesis anti-sigma factor FlgM [Vibrio harveyi]
MKVIGITPSLTHFSQTKKKELNFPVTDSQVHMSNELKALSHAKELLKKNEPSNFDMDKVRDMKNLINNSTYTINIDDLADDVLRFYCCEG